MSSMSKFSNYIAVDEDHEPSQDLLPECRLAIAVLERAFIDATSTHLHYESMHEFDKRKESARKFLEQHDNVWFDILGLDPGWVKKLLGDYRNFLKEQPRKGRSSSRMMGQHTRYGKKRIR